MLEYIFFENLKCCVSSLAGWLWHCNHLQILHFPPKKIFLCNLRWLASKEGAESDKCDFSSQVAIKRCLSSAFCGTDKHQFSGLFAPNLGSICSSHRGGAQYKWADIIGPQVRLFPKIEIHGVPRTKEEWQYNEERLQTLQSSTKYWQKKVNIRKMLTSKFKRDNVEWWSANEEIPRPGRLF